MGALALILGLLTVTGLSCLLGQAAKPNLAVITRKRASSICRNSGDDDVTQQSWHGKAAAFALLWTRLANWPYWRLHSRSSPSKSSDRQSRDTLPPIQSHRPRGRMKRAAAYLRRNRIITCPISKTVSGVGIVCKPVFELAADDAVDLGAAILEALQHSQNGVPHPAQAEWDQVGEAVLRAARVKSWRTLAHSTKYVEVRLETNRVVFAPTRNLGPRDGFSELLGKERSSVPVAAEVGTALLAAFDDAE